MVIGTAPMASVVGSEALIVTTPLNGQAGATNVPFPAIVPPPETDQEGENSPAPLDAVSFTLLLHKKVGPAKPEISTPSDAAVSVLPAPAAS